MDDCRDCAYAPFKIDKYPCNICFKDKKFTMFKNKWSEDVE
jgi:hypothetical protein